MQGEPTPVRRFFGYALAAVGALIAVTAGLCTGWALLALVQNALSTGNGASSEILLAVGLPIVVGGIPTAIGMAIGIAGWRVATRR